jgi:hypothetical protein
MSEATAAPVPEVLEAEVPDAPVVPTAPVVPATTESVGVADDIAAVTDAVGDMGLGPASPIVIIALAAIVVLFGTKGWSFWLQRSEQNHKMAMKKMEMESAEQALAAKGTESSSPKACRLVHEDLKSEIATMKAKEVGQEARLEATERKLQLLASFDPADVDRQIKRVALHADEVDESVVRLARRVRGLEEVDE